MSRKTFLYFSLFYSIVLLIASTISGNNIPKLDQTLFDKILHAIAYAILGFLLVNSFKKEKISTLLFIIIIGTIYGGLNEIWQLYIANRYASFYDGIANAVGMIIGTILTHKYLRFTND
jgi:VanZ family protein